MFDAWRARRTRNYAFESDLLLAVLLAGWAQVDLRTNLAIVNQVPPLLPNVAICLLQTIPLAWRRRAPLTVLLIVASAVALPASANVLHLGLVGVPNAAVLSVPICIYTVSAYGDRNRAAIAALIAAAGPVILQLQIQAESWMLVGGAWLLGYVARRGWQSKERLAVGQERLRIARELHDVVANSVTVIAVQAGAARLNAGNLGPDAGPVRDALGSIEAKSRQTLTEMRGLLGILRSEPPDGGTPGGRSGRNDTDSPLDPQPSLARLEALVAEVCEAGLDVEVTTIGEQRPLPPALELSVYRIIQEALTNALKHVGPTTARVVIRYGAREVEVEVVNEGPVAEPVLAGPRGGGNGLLGMRERAAVFGGSLRAGPRPEGGFGVRVTLPLDQSPL
jgi:signal transduction histidine kinase